MTIYNHAPAIGENNMSRKQTHKTRFLSFISDSSYDWKAVKLCLNDQIYDPTQVVG